MFSRIKGDVDSIYERDPAAHSRWEVLLCYPGLHATLRTVLRTGYGIKTGK